jgi:hypothetical protein
MLVGWQRFRPLSGPTVQAVPATASYVTMEHHKNIVMFILVVSHVV